MKRPDLFAEFERTCVRPRTGQTLIVGSRVYKGRADRRKLYKDAIGVDIVDGEGVDVVCNLTSEGAIYEKFGAQQFDHVDCISVLEHCTYPASMASNIVHLMKAKATLFLTAPFVWRVHAYPDDYHRFTISGIAHLFPRINWSRLCYADMTLHEDVRVPQEIINGIVHFARCEVYGFGALRE